MRNLLVEAAELRLSRLYREAELERQRPQSSRLSYRVAAGLLRLLRHLETKLEAVLVVETTLHQAPRPDVP